MMPNEVTGETATQAKIKRLAEVQVPAPTPDDAAATGEDDVQIAFRCPQWLADQIDKMTEEDEKQGYPRSRSAVIRRVLMASFGGATTASS